MTREEAIEFGNMWFQINEDCKDSSTYAFFQMAIKALEQEQTTKNDLGVEKIIDEIEKEFEKVDIPIMDKLTLFAKVQNALYKCAVSNSEIPNNSTTKNDLAVDCISRQAVIDLINAGWKPNRNIEKAMFILDINSLPSVTPQEPITWIVGKNNAQIAVKNMPIDKLQKICAIIGDEQEPILDKIREEIKVMTSNRGFLSCSVGYIHKEIDNVFDKYKAESEDKE